MHRRRSALVLSVAGAVLAGALAGCGDVNAGTAAAAEFDAWWPDHRVEGFEATSNGGNTLPFAGELDVTVRAEPGVEVDDLEQVRDVVCSFDPDATATVTLTLVAQVATVGTPCIGSDLDSGAFLELDDFLVSLDVESAEVGRGTPEIDVVLPDGTKPAQARRVVRLVGDFVPTVARVFIEVGGDLAPLPTDAPVDVSVRVGRRFFSSEDAVGDR